MTNPIPVRVKRYGVDAALPRRRTLTAGPLTAVLENADLRYVHFGDVHVVLRLYMAVRNRNWDTIEPRFTSFEVTDRGDGFLIELTAENVAGDVDFAWSGRIEGTPDGTISYRMEGAPRTTFLKNRIGFCVLHPMELAGLPATVETPEGTVESAFPAAISPHQPFIDMISINHPAGPNGRVTIRFEGDLFEAEDQRNWTDASYKTYSTPLRLPYPVEVTPETRIAQSVTIQVTGQPSRTAAGSAPDIVIDLDRLAPLPPIGFGAGRAPLPAGEPLERLRALAPAHLWADLDLGAAGWRERLAIVAGNARLVDAPLDLSVIGGPGETGWDDLAAAIAADGIRIGRVFAFPPVTEPVVFPRYDLATHPETIAAARSAFTAAGIDAAIGGGTRAYFTELNRATAFLPVDRLDMATYPINPQAHASDNLSLIETLAAQAETVRSARAIIGDRPLAVGPVTLKPPYNPNATAPPPEPGPDQLPDPVDPRQLSLFGAGWTLGSIHRLAGAGVEALTYYELQGWRGVQERLNGLSRRDRFPSRPGQLFPLYHIFAAITDFGGGQIGQVSLADGLATEALALRHGERVRLLIASFAEEERAVSIAVPGLRNVTVRMLDETTYDSAAGDPSFFRSSGGTAVPVEDGRFGLTMLPFAVACVDGTL